MTSIVDLYARQGEGATLTLWRTGVTNADTVVTLDFDPALTGASAVAFDDASGDDQGRVDITIPTDAPEGIYAWSAEIDSVVVWAGYVYIGSHGAESSTLAHSPDIRGQEVPQWIVYRPEDVELSEIIGSGVPDGGLEGEVLTKLSDDDGDADWEPGTPGPEGPEGPAGPKGDTGDQGPQGEPGVNGDGAPGTTWRITSGAPDDGIGINGDFMLDLAVGAGLGDVYVRNAGAYDLDGNIRGPTGATGPEGDPGPKGDTGDEGPKGDTGDPGADGADGEDGSPGVDGRTIRTGIGAPDDGVGADGDLWIDEVSPFAWYAREAGAYDLKGNLKGAQGDPGVDGTDGADGADGANGQGVPTGGTTGQQLEKIDGTDFNTQWVTRGHVPTGGSTGQALVKTSGTDFAAAFQTVGDVTAAAAFGTDNVLIRSDSTGKGVQASGIGVSDTNALTGVADLSMTGTLAVTGPITVTSTVDGRDVSTDGAALDALGTTVSNQTPLIRTLTADHVLTTTSFNGVAPASGPVWTGISLVAGKTYQLTIFGKYQTSATTTTFQFGVDWTNAPTNQALRASVGANTASAQTWAEKYLRSDAETTDNTGSSGATGSDYAFTLDGTFTADASTPGTFDVVARTRITTSGETVTAKAGSTLILRRLN